MDPQSVEKTVLCPRLGYGLYELAEMPYDLTGAAQTYPARMQGLCQGRLHYIFY